MVDYYTILGMVLACFIAIIGIYFSIKSNAQKEKEPINELNLNIVKLTAVIENMEKNDLVRDKRLDKHGKEIDDLNKVVNLHEIRLNAIDKDCKTIK